jgi:hypothetical protein
MPEPTNLLKAELREISWDDQQQVQEGNPEKTVQVQFNPETLKVNFSNQKAGGDQRGGSAVQFVGAGSTKLTLDLWFDVTVPLPDGSLQPDGDVRKLTEKVTYFITPTKVPGEEDKWIPPGVRFIWGTFLFDGVMDSLNENLEYFSEEGKPLRAGVSISLSKQEIQFQFGNQAPPGNGGENAPGTQPMQPARAGDSVQDMASRAGKPDDWKAVAAANNIENPRQLGAGALLDMSAKMKGGVSAGVGISGSIGASAGAGISAGASAGFSADASIS